MCSSTRRSLAWPPEPRHALLAVQVAAVRLRQPEADLAGRTCRDRRRQRPIARASSADLQGGQSIHASYVRPRHRAREISSSLPYRSPELGAGRRVISADSIRRQLHVRMCLLRCRMPDFTPISVRSVAEAKSRVHVKVAVDRAMA